MSEKIIALRNIFYKGFLVGLAYYIFITLLYVFNKPFFVSIMANYYMVDAKDTYILCGYYLGAIELFIGCFLLIPALTLHLVSCTCKKDKK